MHFLQKTILDSLRYKQPLAYTALMPDGIESSHFRYHLKQLTTDGLVEKDSEGRYRLSHKGSQEVDYLSGGRTTQVRTPKVITYTLLTHRDGMLLYKKPKDPYRNLLGLIGGKVHFGEDMQQAAQREVYEKIGLVVTPPDFQGVAAITISAKGRPLSHVVAYIFSVEVPTLPSPLSEGLVMTDRKHLTDYDVLPDLLPLLNKISISEHPFVEAIHCNME